MQPQRRRLRRACLRGRRMGRVVRVGTMWGLKFSLFCKASGTRSSREAPVTHAAEWKWPRLGCACRREDTPTGAAPGQDNEKPQMQTDEFKTRIAQTNQKYSRSQAGSRSRDLRIRRSDRFLGAPCGRREGAVGSGPRYQILSHVFARCTSKKNYGRARIARDSRMAVGFLTDATSRCKNRATPCYSA